MKKLLILTLLIATATQATNNNELVIDLISSQDPHELNHEFTSLVKKFREARLNCDYAYEMHEEAIDRGCRIKELLLVKK